MSYSQWRVVLNILPTMKAPTFDEAKHSGICREVCDLSTYTSLCPQRITLAAQVSLCRDYEGSDESVDHRFFEES